MLFYRSTKENANSGYGGFRRNDVGVTNNTNKVYGLIFWSRRAFDGRRCFQHLFAEELWKCLCGEIFSGFIARKAGRKLLRFDEQLLTTLPCVPFAVMGMATSG